jgi:hypothetical protein
MADPTKELQDVLTDASRTQFAAVSAAVAFWSEWAESAGAYSREMADELSRLSFGDAPSDEALSRMIDLNREYLRRLTEVPTSAVTRFNEELAKIDEQRKARADCPPDEARQRQARAKE